MIRTVLLVGALLLGALSTPLPWGALWLAVPATVCASLLVSWRWGPWGVLLPIALLGIELLTVGPFAPWAWWIPVAALCGSWMGLREEGAGVPAGRRAWMLLPLLLLAAGVPWTLSYPGLVEELDRTLQGSDRQLIERSRQIGTQGERLEAMSRVVEESAALRRRSLPNLLPSLLFVWMTILVTAGRTVSARIAQALRWPDPGRSRLADWRLPDGAIWLLLSGMGLLVAGLPGWGPSAWTLLLAPALGYCVQGIAVVESLLLWRGIPPSMIVLTFLFVFLMAFPVFLLATLAVGISDIWLDYRRLESAAGGDAS